jgi:GDPmannose 4,6-dehydratase
MLSYRSGRSNLLEFLLKKGCEVHGIKRWSSGFSTRGGIDRFYQDPHVANKYVILHYGDLTDTSNLIYIIQQAQLPEIHWLFSMSVVVSFFSALIRYRRTGENYLRIILR